MAANQSSDTDQGVVVDTAGRELADVAEPTITTASVVVPTDTVVPVTTTNTSLPVPAAPPTTQDPTAPPGTPYQENGTWVVPWPTNPDQPNTLDVPPPPPPPAPITEPLPEPQPQG